MWISGGHSINGAFLGMVGAILSPADSALPIVVFMKGAGLECRDHAECPSKDKYSQLFRLQPGMVISFW